MQCSTHVDPVTGEDCLAVDEDGSCLLVNPVTEGHADAAMLTDLDRIVRAAMWVPHYRPIRLSSQNARRNTALHGTVSMR